MEAKIRTYKKRPECEVPGCKEDGYMLVANRWICGTCYMKWDKEQKRKEQLANDAMFKDIVEAQNEENN